MAEVEVRDAAGTADIEVEVDVGDEIVIRLPENPTTGYVWSIESTSDGLLLVGDSNTAEAAGAADTGGATGAAAGGGATSAGGSGGAGGSAGGGYGAVAGNGGGAATSWDAAAPPEVGGTRVMRLRLAGPAGGQVLLRLRRGWEAEPLDERRITVTVRR